MTTEQQSGAVAHVDSNVEEAVMELLIIRAGGTTEPGPVLYYNKNPLKRLMWRLRYGKEGERYPRKGINNGDSSHEPRPG